MQWGGIMKPRKKYKVIITRESYVEADNEQEAQIQADNSLVMGEVDYRIEEEKEG